MQKIVDGHTLIARFDMVRRVWAVPKIAEDAQKNGLLWLVRELARDGEAARGHCRR